MEWIGRLVELRWAGRTKSMKVRIIACEAIGNDVWFWARYA